MHQGIIDNIFNKFKDEGYVAEDAIFDVLVENDVPLDKVDYICGVLLSRGVIIRNDSIEEDNDDLIYDYSQVNYEEIFIEVIKIDEGLSFFIDEIRTVIPPQYREWQNLILQAKGGNKYAKERMVSMYLRNVVRIALYHYERYKVSLSDAIQDGCVGLTVSIEKFEIGKHDNFLQYASWWIRQYIMRKAELKGSFFRYPAHYKEKMFLTYDIINQHSCEQCLNNGLCITLINEVMEKLESGHDEAVILLNRLLFVLSYENIIETNEDIFNDRGLLVEELDSQIDNENLRLSLEDVLSVLKPREREVIELRFGLDNKSKPRTLEEVGKVFGVTRERIRQIEAKVIKKLRHPVRAKKIKPFW